MVMLPRLQAEEQLASIETTALAMGHYEKGTAREKLARMRDAAFGQSVSRKRGVRAQPGQLGAIGIGVRMLPPPAGKALSDV